MSARVRACVAVAALALCALACAQAQVAVPELKAHVTDLTATLQPAQRDALESKLAALEQRKGAQVAVLILPSIQPETIEQFAIRTFDAWKLGRQGVDDGALLIVAKGDRKVRIEVGRGLEGAIPDVTAHRIIDEYLTPRFREGDFAGGIDAATDALGKLVDGEALPEPYRAPNSGSSDIDGNTALIVWFWLTLLICGVLSGLPGALRVPLVGGIVGVAMNTIGVVAPMFVVAGFASAIVSLWFRSAGKFVGSGGSGGWSSGGGGGGGWSSGSSSSGSSWSGGGGSSAGGGASGSW